MFVGQFGLSVPNVILDGIMREYTSDDERKSALANYIVVTIPNVSWETIAAKLYSLEEMRAVEQAKLFIHRTAGELVSA